MSDTRIQRVDATHPDTGILDEAAGILFRGGLVAFPTETVYGLGADAFNDAAVQSVYDAKGRPADNPLIVHLAHADQMAQVASEIPDDAIACARTFWPGPLTLVLKGNGAVPPEVTAGLETIAVRVPDHPVPRGLVDRLGRGIVGPSANTSGRPSPTTADHVFADLQGKVDMILDSGPTRVGIESTVVDLTVRPPAILRPGGIHREQLEKLIGPLAIGPQGHFAARSPGTRHRHYAPEARVHLVPMHDEVALIAAIAEHVAAGRKVGVIVQRPTFDPRLPATVVALGSTTEEFARKLFGALRELDDSGVSVIVVEQPPDVGLGLAVADRLRRAAQGP